MSERKLSIQFTEVGQDPAQTSYAAAEIPLDDKLTLDDLAWLREGLPRYIEEKLKLRSHRLPRGEAAS